MAFSPANFFSPISFDPQRGQYNPGYTAASNSLSDDVLNSNFGALLDLSFITTSGVSLFNYTILERQGFPFPSCPFDEKAR